MAQSDRTSMRGAHTLFVSPTGVDNTYDKKRRVFAVPTPTPGGRLGDGLVSRHGGVGVTTSTEAKVVNKYAELHAEDGEDHLVSTEVVQSWTGLQSIILQYVNTGKYCFILQILMLALFTEVLLISILMFSIQKIILIYWYFQYFPVSLFYVPNHFLTAVA
jgi:hypothetical protein